MLIQYLMFSNTPIYVLTVVWTNLTLDALVKLHQKKKT